MPFPPTPSNSPSNTPTPSITPSVTPTLTPTGTPCPEITATATPTNSVTPSITASNTATPTNTPSNTATPSQTATNNPTQTQTPSNTATPSQTATIGSTPTQTPSQTGTPPPTATMTQTPSPTSCNNVTTVFGYMEPCIGGTIDDHMGAAVFVQNAVSVNTTFEVEVSFVYAGNSCGSGESTQTFSVPMDAGFSSSSFNACSNGLYVVGGAVICSACIISCDNPEVCIPSQFLC